MANNRLDKINNELKKTLAEVINFKLKDEIDNAIVSVLEAKTTLNLEFCDVYVSILAPNEEQINKVFQTLQKNLTYIRSEVAKLIKLRAMPRINLHLDKSEQYSAHINSLLTKIKNEQK